MKRMWLSRYADGEAIDGATSMHTPTTDAGAIISVSAVYTDQMRFLKLFLRQFHYYSQVVSDAASLVSAINGGNDGDVIGLATNVYTDLDAIMLTSKVTAALR